MGEIRISISRNCIYCARIPVYALTIICLHEMFGTCTLACCEVQKMTIAKNNEKVTALFLIINCFCIRHLPFYKEESHTHTHTHTLFMIHTGIETSCKIAWVCL